MISKNFALGSRGIVEQNNVKKSSWFGSFEAKLIKVITCYVLFYLHSIDYHANFCCFEIYSVLAGRESSHIQQ